MAGRQTIDQWIREALLDTEKDGDCTALSLIHMTGTRENEIHTMKLGGRAMDPKELAQIFRTKAENHAAEIPGTQTFNLLAFYANRPEPQARKPFTVVGEATDAGQLVTEGPTEKGIIQQTMRHNEAYTQITLRHTAAMIESSARMLDRMATHNEKLMKENHDALEIIKELTLGRITDQREHDLKRLQYERETAERQKWLSYGPALVNGLLNREIFPQATADTALIEAIIENISEDDIVKLSSIIKPELWGPLAQRMKQSMERKRKAHETHRELTNGVDPMVELS
jgi:hypothetical protein